MRRSHTLRPGSNKVLYPEACKCENHIHSSLQVQKSHTLRPEKVKMWYHDVWEANIPCLELWKYQNPIQCKNPIPEKPGREKKTLIVYLWVALAVHKKSAVLTSDLTPKSCEECTRKEKVIGQLYEKMEGLEEAVDAFCKDQQRQLDREKSMGMGQQVCSISNSFFSYRGPG